MATIIQYNIFLLILPKGRLIMNLASELSGLQRSIERLLSEGRSPFTAPFTIKRQLVTSKQYRSHHQQIILL